MHEHLEIVLPYGTEDIEVAIESVMGAFDESGADNYLPFWDWYVIGGRFAGEKAIQKYDPAQRQAFLDWCIAENVTVSSLQCGKQKLQPASQIAKVDAKWNEMFPSDVMVACPLFQHSNDPYGRDGKGTLSGDISPLRSVKRVKCSRIIFAGPSYESETKSGIRFSDFVSKSETSSRTGPLEAVFMLALEVFNGVNFMEVRWDGTIGDAIEKFEKLLTHMSESYREVMTPTDDSITVTVDYHS